MNVAIAAKVCVILCLVLEVQCSEKRQSDSCSDPESYFSTYCWNVVTNNTDSYDYDTVVEVLCTDCRQNFIEYYRECVDAESAEQVDETCTSLGYPNTPPTSPPPTPPVPPTPDSCSDPESYFSSYCWNGITNADDYDALIDILCIDCRKDTIDFYQECVDAESAEQVDEQCTSFGYPNTPPTSPPPTPPVPPTPDSCSDPESYFSSYCWNGITNADDYDALIEILCTDCRQDTIDFYQECFDADTAEQVDEQCTSLGYPPPTTPPTTPPTIPPTPSSGVSLGAVIGGVVGGVVGLIALIFVVILFCCCCCYSLNKTTQSSVQRSTQTPSAGTHPTVVAPVVGYTTTAPYPTADPVKGGYPEGYSAATPAVYYPTAAPMGYYVPGTTSTIDNTCPPPYESAMDYPSASGTANPE